MRINKFQMEEARMLLKERGYDDVVHMSRQDVMKNAKYEGFVFIEYRITIRPINKELNHG